MLLMAIQISLMVFYTTVDVSSTSPTPVVYSGANDSEAVVDSGGLFTTAMFFQFIATPTQWAASAFILALVAFVGAMAIAGVRVAGFTAVSSDTVRFAPLFLAMFGLGSIPVVGLWEVIAGGITPLACEVGAVSCFASWMGAFLCVMPITVLWFLSCLTWWRTGAIGS